ncbi:hypothetical protein BGW80DRAFT_231957 [Lactifluus volemus]|nr:hypothetical protein BGW80DRAFT_231957 [Lactifluus volemus]
MAFTLPVRILASILYAHSGVGHLRFTISSAGCCRSPSPSRWIARCYLRIQLHITGVGRAHLDSSQVWARSTQPDMHSCHCHCRHRHVPITASSSSTYVAAPVAHVGPESGQPFFATGEGAPDLEPVG